MQFKLYQLELKEGKGITPVTVEDVATNRRRWGLNSSIRNWKKKMIIKCKSPIQNFRTACHQRFSWLASPRFLKKKKKRKIYDEGRKSRGGLFANT